MSAFVTIVHGIYINLALTFGLAVPYHGFIYTKGTIWISMRNQGSILSSILETVKSPQHSQKGHGAVAKSMLEGITTPQLLFNCSFEFTLAIWIRRNSQIELVMNQSTIDGLLDLLTKNSSNDHHSKQVSWQYMALSSDKSHLDRKITYKKVFIIPESKLKVALYLLYYKFGQSEQFYKVFG